MMNLTIKNVAIILIFLFLMSSQIIGILFGLAKASLYLILFILVVNKISPELYNYLANIFKFDKLKLQNIPNTVINAIKKIFDLIKNILTINKS